MFQVSKRLAASPNVLSPEPTLALAGQIHNFYIQTVRDNKNSRRTPQWSVQHGLVDDSTMKRRKKRNEWSNRYVPNTVCRTSSLDPGLYRYNDRLPQSALDGAEFAPDQIPDPERPAPTPTVGGARSPAALWREDDSEGFYDRTKVESPRGQYMAALALDP